MIRTVLICLLASFQVSAQDTVRLSLQEVLFNVTRYHPVARQAEIIVLSADGNLMMARGGFDPVLGLGFDEKKLNKKHYYSQFGSGLKIPTPVGVELKGGFERAAGSNVNDANETATDGLFFAGISVPFGRRLFTDERRTALKQAKLFINQSSFDRQALLNELFAIVIDDYTTWAVMFAQYQIYDSAATLAQNRLEIIKAQFLSQEKASPDTLEAYLQYQSRLVERNAIEASMIKSYYQLESHLWNEDSSPLVPSLTAPIIPEHPDSILFVEPREQIRNLDDFTARQPLLQSGQLQIQSLDAERQLKVEMLKPQLDLQYNFIQEPFYNGNSILSNASFNNYRIGVNFYMPLFLRKERGSLELAKLKVRSKQLDWDMKQRSLWNKYLAAIRQQDVYTRQLEEVRQMVVNYNRLLQVENLKFGLGESSLFMINAREVKLIDSKVKVVETWLKLFEIKLEQLRLKGEAYQPN